jgi:hypothetical protein
MRGRPGSVARSASSRGAFTQKRTGTQKGAGEASGALRE